jgi:hypothetical protein
MRATKANEWSPFAITIKESVQFLPRSSVVFHTKASWAVRECPDTIPSEQPYNEVSYLASEGISAHMCQYTTQTLVPKGSTDVVLN